MNVSDALNYFATGTYTVTRRDKGSYINGDFTADTTPTDIVIRALVMPAGGRELQRLPEGMRSKEVILLFTATEVLTQSATHNPDTIRWGGQDYGIQMVERWDELGGFFRALASRIGG